MGMLYNELDLDHGGQDKSKNTQRPDGKKPLLLETFGSNLTDMAKNNLLDPVIGRDLEIERAVQILGRRKKNNPILVGHAGVGKTSIVEGLAQRIINNEVPTSLQNMRVFNLDLTNLVSGTKYRGEFEERMKIIISELKENQDIIVFIDEIHTMMGAGNSSGGLDVSNIIKPALAKGEIRCIGATTFDEYRESIETDAALNRRFQEIFVEEPSAEETTDILLNSKIKYEEFHNVTYSNEVIRESVKLADRYITNRFFPDKALDIIDEAGSYVKTQIVSYPKKLKDLENKLDEIEKLKLTAARSQDYEQAAKMRDVMNALKTRIYEERTAWKKSVDSNPPKEVTLTDIYRVISKITGVPLEKLSQKQFDRLIKLPNILKTNVIGQNEAIDKLSETIQKNSIGLRRKNKTIGNFMFLGPTGVGKTFLVKKLAEELFDDTDAIIRFDMGEFTEPHSVSKLVGSPPGYVGFEDGGQLTEAVRRNPYSIILFDEIEKAHPIVYTSLLQLLDEGHMTDSSGRKVNFKNCLIIMTSNVGVKESQSFSARIGFGQQDTKQENEREIIGKSLQQRFAPEFLNRIDDIIIFNQLEQPDIIKILDLDIAEFKESLSELGNYQISITASAKKLLAETGYNPSYGARFLKRMFESKIENRVSKMILHSEFKEGDTLTVKAKNGELDFKIKSN